MIFNMTGGSGNGGTLTVTGPAGVTAIISKDDKVKTKVIGSDGITVFKGLTTGTWQLTITDGVQTFTKSVSITADYNVAISFSKIPDFTYTGNFEIVNDSDEPIESSPDDWKIRFLSSGTLVFTNLKGAEDGIDVFLVGGGGAGGGNAAAYNGCGGGGGYTETLRNISVIEGQAYDINVGLGGIGGVTTDDKNGKPTSAFSTTVNGGIAGTAGYNAGAKGGDGGSGGGYNGYSGGENGADGGGSGTLYIGGTGQKRTTREFEEADGKLYAAGGGGYKALGGDGGGGNGASDINTNGESGVKNTGSGGGGASAGAAYNGGNGADGIVIIRNKREPNATISVTYPNGYTCTCSDGSTVLNAPDTSGHWECVVPNIGSWVVSCTNGSEYSESEVDILLIKQHSTVKMVPFTYLYKDGNQYTSITGGWKSYIPTSAGYGVAFENDGIKVTNNGGVAANWIAAAFTVNKIRVEEFTRLHAEFTYEQQYTGSYANIGLNSVAAITPDNTYVAVSKLASTDAYSGKVSVPLVGVTDGEYYIGFNTKFALVTMNKIALSSNEVT